MTSAFTFAFWIGLTDGRSNGTWRGLGFAYAAIFLLSNTFLYVAKNPDQARKKLGLFMIALFLSPMALYALDSHVGKPLLSAMYFSPVVTMNNALLNPRFLEQYRATRTANPAPFVWKTAWRPFASALALSFLIIIIIKICKSGNLDLSLGVWLKALLVMFPGCLVLMIMVQLSRSRAKTRREMGRDERTRDDTGT
jgi:hypothetical protein